MSKKAFTLIEVIVALLILSVCCCIMSTSAISSVNRRKKAERINEGIQACSVILECFKDSGGANVKSIYDLSPKSPEGRVSGYICFNELGEIKQLVENLNSFNGYWDYSDSNNIVHEKRYTAYIAISKGKSVTTWSAEYPVEIQLRDNREETATWIHMDYGFLSGI